MSLIRLQESILSARTRTSTLVKKDDGQFSEKEAQSRFEAALRSALKTSPKPLKEKPKVEKMTKVKKKQPAK